MKKLLSLLIFFCIAHTHAQEKTPWTIFIYMEASEAMHDAAFKNLNDLARVGPPDNVNVIVLLHTWNDNAWFYRIGNKSLNLLESIKLEPSVANNLIAGMRYTVKNYPADNYCMILWDHGFGVLEPHYIPQDDKWLLESDTPGGELFEPTVCTDDACPLPKVKFPLISTKRSMMVDSYHKTVLHNKDMVNAFDTIVNDVLDGQKIAVCGMDLCLGAMIEHGYQLRKYVDFMIGSQDCEMMDGWDYAALMQELRNNPHICAHDLACSVVKAYVDYYEPIAPVGRYTHSAIDLSYCNQLKQNIDTVVKGIDKCAAENKAFALLVKYASKECPHFCFVSMYVDLHNFYEELLHAINDYSDIYEITPPFEHLKQTLLEGQKLIDTMVIANGPGRARSFAHGLSIYLPQNHIDSSYPGIPFAQDSLWVSLLEKYIVE